MMKQFMHVGVPTDKIMEGAVYAEAIKTYIVAPETNEFNIEYLRFEKDTPLPKELQTMVHVAYKVDDLDEQVKANTVVVEPHSILEHKMFKNNTPVRYKSAGQA